MPHAVNPGPQRIDAAGGPYPLHDTAASRAAEQTALALQPPFALMASAGLAVARLTLAIAPTARRVQVWAGPGNNGGDGLVAARHLHAAGLDVTVNLLADPARLPADAARALFDARGAGVQVELGLERSDGSADVNIDALLGIGSRRAPEGELAQAITAMNAGMAPVLAIDIPSGLNPDTGATFGAVCVRADITLALLTLKPGCFTAAGRDAAGQVWLDDLAAEPGPPTAWLAGPAAIGPRHHASHKGSHGDVVVVGGAPGMTGAAWLAARAALAAGAGRVYCSLLDESASLLDPNRPELMGRRAWWCSPPAALQAATVVCGCGGGDAVRAALPPLLSRAGRLVLDADGLNAIAADPALAELLRRRGGTDGTASLLTPHPLEAARLLGRSAHEVQADRLNAAHTLAAMFGCTVLLKGSGTVIASPSALPQIVPTGNAALATAGTGDVLAGWVAGLWAQSPQARAGDIASAAAWMHGRCADRWPAAARGAALRASDLIEALAQRDFQPSGR